MSAGAVTVPAEVLLEYGARVLEQIGCPPEIAREVAAHLVDADLCGVYSHGTMRLLQYAEWARDGVFDPSGVSAFRSDGKVVDGADGFGIPAMRMAAEEAARRAQTTGVGAVGVVNCGHTGRIGAFAEMLAEANCLGLIFGGGSGKDWPQVAPFGGAEGRLPTNPYAIALPGGDAGPVMLDFATSAGAGGKIYAASYAGQALPEGLLLDRDGAPSTDPADYYAGGALLPMAGPKGYGLGLIAELMGGALLGDVRSGMSWIVIALSLDGFRAPDAYRQLAEDILARIRTCPPAPGFETVEIPGERERRQRDKRRTEGIPIPAETLTRMRAMAAEMGIDPV